MSLISASLTGRAAGTGAGAASATFTRSRPDIRMDILDTAEKGWGSGWGSGREGRAFFKSGAGAGRAAPGSSVPSPPDFVLIRESGIAAYDRGVALSETGAGAA